MIERSLSLHGILVPRFLYGTAWKEEQTQDLTELALDQGFRGIDTANQRKHYHEAAVGSALSKKIESGVVAREDLFLQTKFTPLDGQDDRLPYDPNASISVQVEQSFNSSLEHLRTDYLDSYLLHGPTYRTGLTSEDWEAWRAIETLHDTGKVRLIGVSNFSLDQLEDLLADSRVKPAFVQNRCYARLGWDKEVRNLCAAEGIVYQGFSLLTANRRIQDHSELTRIADRYGKSTAQIIFRFALEVGMICLTGTKDPDHMRSDLEVFDFDLAPEEIGLIEGLGVAST